MRPLLFGVLAACSYSSPQGSPGGDGDAQPSPDACVSFSSQTDTCELAFDGPLTLTGNLDFDTGTGELLLEGSTQIPVTTVTLMTAGGEVKAILATTVVFQGDAQLRATGTRAFGILATDSITLSSGAAIDVGDNGAGARATCPNGAQSIVGISDGGAGGGGGAGFAGAGGNGGAGNANANAGAVGGQPQALPLGIVGGCPGGKGGDDNNDPGGAGGAGGGAVYLAAGRRIEIMASATIQAGGGAGRGGQQDNGAFGDAGGGGGGSGGMIVLEAPAAAIAGTLAANGGGGGQGSGNFNPGGNGTPGRLDTMPAAGGRNTSSSGSNGGDGGARDQLEARSVTANVNGGGGGGGGSVGYIRIVSPAASATGAISPAPQ